MKIGVCYTFPLQAPALLLPEGVLSIEHANCGTRPTPVRPSISAQTAKPLGRLLNFEPAGLTPTPLKHWPAIFRSGWPSSGRCWAYGIDASVNDPRQDHPIGRLAMALRRPIKPGQPIQHASFAVDGYPRHGYETRRNYLPWARWRSNRAEEVHKATGTRSAFCIEVQAQMTVDDPYGGGAVIHDEDTIAMQIQAAGGNDLLIYAGATTPETRKKVDAAVLRALELAQAMRGPP
jgi:hypothetical protein